MNKHAAEDNGTRKANGAAGASSREARLIAELQERTAELEEANRELRRISHYRSVFLARMSHELRTPLTSILGFSEILLDQEKLSDTQRRFCQKVQDSGFQLQASLNQLVDLSRLEAGQTEVFLQEFSVRETLRESCAAVARMAQKQQLTVEYDLDQQVGTVVSDQGKLRQTLFNFIAWAVSRSPMTSTVHISADVPEKNCLRFRITDDGQQIDDLTHLFDPPEMSAGAEPNVNELGIIIARRLLELINGTVSLSNREETGVEVEIKLPLRPAKG